MEDERAQVLENIRTALKTAHLPGARITVPPRAAIGQGEVEAMIENFRRELEPLGGASYRAQNDDEAIEIILKLLGDVNGKELLMWDDSEIPVRGLWEVLSSNNYTRQKIEMPDDAAGRKNRLLELERAGAGITGAAAGIADTGTVAFVSSATRPRLASLLPPTHIAILQTSQMFPNMASFFSAKPDVMRDASNLVFVTGPSRTADIELTLQRGVHGPKFLHVILLGG